MKPVDIFSEPTDDDSSSKKRATFIAPTQAVEVEYSPAPETNPAPGAVRVQDLTPPVSKKETRGNKKLLTISVIAGGALGAVALAGAALLTTLPTEETQNPPASTVTEEQTEVTPSAPTETPNNQTSPQPANEDNNVYIPQGYEGEGVIGFEPFSNQLTPQGIQEIQKIVTQIPDGAEVEVIGYVSSNATSDTFTLDQRRAETVAQELTKQNINVTNVEGRGKLQKAVTVIWRGQQ